MSCRLRSLISTAVNNCLAAGPVEDERRHRYIDATRLGLTLLLFVDVAQIGRLEQTLGLKIDGDSYIAAPIPEPQDGEIFEVGRALAEAKARRDERRPLSASPLRRAIRAVFPPVR